MLLFEVSCKPCRQWHCKCDRTLPCCSQCAKRGITCEYVPRKRKRNAMETEEDEEQDGQHTPTSSQHLVVKQATKQSPTVQQILRHELSQLYLPESYYSVNSDLLQFLFTEIFSENMPSAKLIRQHLKHAMQYFESCTNKNINYITLSYLLSSQGFACLRMHKFDEAKNYAAATLQLLQKGNILSYYGLLLAFKGDGQNYLNHPILASTLIQIIIVMTIDGKQIHSTKLLISFLNSYFDYQKSKLSTHKNKLLEERLKQNWKKIAYLQGKEIDEAECSSDVEVDGFIIAKEEIHFQYASFEQITKLLHLNTLLLEDDIYYSQPIQVILEKYLEIMQYKPMYDNIPLIQKFLKEEDLSELIILLSSLNSYLNRPELVVQNRTASPFFDQIMVQAMVCFENTCAFVENIWKSQSYVPIPQSPWAIFSFLLALRGLRIRFIHQLVESIRLVDKPFKKIIEGLLLSAANEFIQIIISHDIVKFVRAHFVVRRFAVEIALLHCEYIDTEYMAKDGVALLEADVEVLEKLRISNFVDENVDMLIQQLKTLIVYTVQNRETQNMTVVKNDQYVVGEESSNKTKQL